jgi:hypothetical protein
MTKFRVGRRETFMERAHGVMYSGRKTLSTRMTFATNTAIAVTFGVGAIIAGTDLAIDTPLSPQILPESKGVKTVQFAVMSGLAIFGYYNAEQAGRDWWIDETGITRKPKEAKK